MRPLPALVVVLLAAAPVAAALDASYDVPTGLPTAEQVVEGGFVVAMEFASDGTLVYGELTGAIEALAPGAEKPERLYSVPAIRGMEWGLTGLTLAPDFPESKTLYVAYTTGPEGVDPNADDAKGTMKVVRLDPAGETVLFTIEATRSHNSGRLLLHDGLLFFSNGEHTTGSGSKEQRMLAQDPGHLHGKILRMTVDGEPAPGNPYETDPNYDPYVYSMGHRNPFGLAWDHERDRLVMSDPGPECCEEINVIEPGGNYGWPVCRGVCDPPRPGITDPLVFYPKVITPVGMAVVGREYFTGAFNSNEIRRAYETTEGWTDEIVGLIEAGPLDIEASPDGSELWVGTWNGVWKLPTPEPRTDAPPPEETPPVEEPPVEEPPVDEPPVDGPPVDEPPTDGDPEPRETLPPAVGKGVPLPALLAVGALALAAARRRR